MSDVANKLNQSRREHREGRRTQSTDRAASVIAYGNALALRLEAGELDPTFSDPSWLDDLKNTAGVVMRHPGRSTLEAVSMQHRELIGHFRNQIGETANPVISSQPENRVIAPPGVAVEDTQAFQQLKKEHEPIA